MKALIKLGLLVALLCICVSGRAQTSVAGYPFGLCTQGAIQASTSGLRSTNYLQSAFPQCTVTVYVHGTQTLATLYSTSNLQPLSNPFTAQTNAIFRFYAVTTFTYDIQMSAPGMVTTTISDVAMGGGGGGGGGGGSPCPSVNAIQIAANPPTTFNCDATIVIIPATHELDVTSGPVKVGGDITGNRFTMKNISAIPNPWQFDVTTPRSAANSLDYSTYAGDYAGHNMNLSNLITAQTGLINGELDVTAGPITVGGPIVNSAFSLRNLGTIPISWILDITTPATAANSLNYSGYTGDYGGQNMTLTGNVTSSTAQFNGRVDTVGPLVMGATPSGPSFRLQNNTSIPSNWTLDITTPQTAGNSLDLSTYTGAVKGISIQTGVRTVGALPAASGVSGMMFVVTDALTNGITTCTGGGSVTMIAVSNGSNWTCH